MFHFMVSCEESQDLEVRFVHFMVSCEENTNSEVRYFHLMVSCEENTNFGMMFFPFYGKLFGSPHRCRRKPTGAVRGHPDAGWKPTSAVWNPQGLLGSPQALVGSPHKRCLGPARQMQTFGGSRHALLVRKWFVSARSQRTGFKARNFNLRPGAWIPQHF